MKEIAVFHANQIRQDIYGVSDGGKENGDRGIRQGGVPAGCRGTGKDRHI